MKYLILESKLSKNNLKRLNQEMFIRSIKVYS